MLLGRPFSLYEIEYVVKSLKCEKAPGPDGLQSEVLQEIITYAGQDLCDLLNACRTDGCMLESINTGLIKLIPKNGDKFDVKNYRPLTMLNTVYKVMAKALASRIKSLVSQRVHPMQYGFVHGRSIHEAILNVISAVEWASEQEEEYVIVNMDLEKAYDRAGWEFLHAVIEKIGFGTMFVKMVNTLFTNAYAAVQVNGYISKKFKLCKSV